MTDPPNYPSPHEPFPPPPGEYQPPQGYPPQGYYPPQGGYYPPQGGYYVPPSAGTNGLAVASLVLGIIWIYWIGSLLAVIFGGVALNQLKTRPGQGGRGLAIAGLVLGLVGLGIFVVLLISGAAIVGGGSTP